MELTGKLVKFFDFASCGKGALDNGPKVCRERRRRWIIRSVSEKEFFRVGKE